MKNMRINILHSRFTLFDKFFGEAVIPLFSFFVFLKIWKTSVEARCLSLNESNFDAG